MKNGQRKAQGGGRAVKIHRVYVGNYERTKFMRKKKNAFDRINNLYDKNID